MGKFNEYTQKATPADNDTMMIYDASAKANKLSPFSGIWNWIVGKLTNAVISNLRTSNQTMIGAINELKSNTHLGTLNDNIAEYLSKTNGIATAYFVWGNIGGLYPSWAWGTLLCSNDNTANFIGIANRNKTAALAHYENGAWEKVPVESLSNLTTTNKSSLVGAINELNSNPFLRYERTYGTSLTVSNVRGATHGLILIGYTLIPFYISGSSTSEYTIATPQLPDGISVSNNGRVVTITTKATQVITSIYPYMK